MAGRGTRRSRSTFDDPDGLDAAYRLGQAAYGVADWAYNNFGSQQEAKMPPRRRRKAVGRRFAASSSRSRSKFGRRTKRTMAGRRRKRVARSLSRKRKFGRSSKLAAARRYGSLVRMMSRPTTLISEYTFDLANIGDNRQNKCSWLIVPTTMGPSNMDACMIGQFNTPGATAADVPADFTWMNGGMSGYIQFKNNGNKRADVELWRIWPKFPIPAADSDLGSLGIGTVNSDFIQECFDSVLEVDKSGGGTLRKPAFDEHGSNLFSCDTFKDTFRVKKVARKFLEPGAWFSRRVVRKKPKVCRKAKWMVNETKSFTQMWQHVPYFGSYWLIRVQGCAGHDESKFPTTGELTTGSTVINGLTTINPGGTTKSAVMTMGEYNVEVYQKRTFVCYTIPGTPAQSRSIGVTTDALATMSHNTFTAYETQVADEASMLP